jgi:predicted metal-binding membrane protein
MVALGWMNLFWMGLFAAIIFAEKIWSKGGLWIARITGVCFITIGILSWAGIISLPFNVMDNVSSNRMSMDMPSSQTHDMTTSHNLITKNSTNSEQGVDKSHNANSKNNTMNGMVMKMIMVVITIYRSF